MIYHPHAIEIIKTPRKAPGLYPKYELITSHTCRRSFASNWYGKLPNSAIMAATGHSKEEDFLRYIKVTTSFSKSSLNFPIPSMSATFQSP